MPQLSPGQLANMRQVMSQNPAMTQALLQQIAATNPGLLQQLGAHPEQVIQEILQSAGDDPADDEEGGPMPPGTHVLSVTQEERAAIERVRFLYFSPKKKTCLTVSFNNSWRPLDSPGSRLSRLTLRVIRMRRWRPTTSLTTLILTNSWITGGIVLLACSHMYSLLYDHWARS